MKTLLSAIRQYRHNNSDEFVMAYDLNETDVIFKRFEEIINLAKDGAELFVKKCQTGNAHSKETYNWCLKLLDKIKSLDSLQVNNMQNKYIPITFNDLDYSTQQRITKLLAKEICKRRKTPPVSNDPCIDEALTEESVQSHLNFYGNDILFELDIEEIGIEAGILK